MPLIDIKGALNSAIQSGISELGETEQKIALAIIPALETALDNVLGAMFQDLSTKVTAPVLAELAQWRGMVNDVLNNKRLRGSVELIDKEQGPKQG